MGEIIDDEISNSQRLEELVDGYAEELFRNTGEHFRNVYESNERLMSALAQRIQLMKSHRNDKFNQSGA